MRSIKFMAIALIAVLTSVISLALTLDHSQMTSSKTGTFKVGGNCDMCKSRIEKAAKTDGVSKAEWDKDKGVLNLVYNPSVVKIDDIQKRIAAAGHDTEKFRASDEVYNSLPGCCHYERMK